MKLTVYSKRWGHDDTYEIKRTEKGWYVGHLAINGEANKRAEPILFNNFRQDSIAYPNDLPDYMEFLWESSIDKDENWIQERLDEISEWIKTVEKNCPDSEFWKQYK